MKKAMLFGINDIRIVEVPKPEIGPDDILVKIAASLVCPSDVRLFRGKGPKILETMHGAELPHPLGHEYSGYVEELGENVRGFARGQRVVGLRVGGFAEYVKLTRTDIDSGIVFSFGEDIPYEAAAFIEPVACCLYCLLNRADVKLGENIAIIGAGSMGLIHLMLTKMIGATTIISDTIERRLEVAKNLGADHVINALKEDPVRAVWEITNGRGADKVISTVGQKRAIEQGLLMVKNAVEEGKLSSSSQMYIPRRGKLVLFGGAEAGTSVEIDPNTIYYRDIIVETSIRVGGDISFYEKSLDIVRKEAEPLRRLITHRFPLDLITEGFNVFEKREGIKVGLAL